MGVSMGFNQARLPHFEALRAWAMVRYGLRCKRLNSSDILKLAWLGFEPIYIDSIEQKIIKIILDKFIILC